jgi:adenylosuccinate lyase
MTSSDVLDTCFNVQLVKAADLLLADMDALLAASSAAPSSTRTPSASAARTASTPSRSPSG